MMLSIDVEWIFKGIGNERENELATDKLKLNLPFKEGKKF